MINRLIFPLSKFAELRRFAWSCRSLAAMRLVLLVAIEREEHRELAAMRVSVPPVAPPAREAERIS